MKSKFLSVALLVSIIFLFSATAFCKIILFYPPNNTLLENETIKLLGFSDESTKENSVIKIEGTGVYEYKFREVKVELTKQNIFSADAHLFPGINKIILDGSIVSVFFNDKTEEIPYTFGKLYEHSEPACENCHKMEPVFSTEITGDVKKVCGECHDMVDGKKNIHPGFTESECTECHNPHFSKFKFHLTSKVEDVCYSCHDNVTQIKKAEFVIAHNPVEKGECAKCHNPHASDNDKLLLKKKYDLCISCHAEKKTSGHGDNYDDCSLCHEHHAAKSFSLLKNKYWDNCLDCHDEVAKQRFKHLPKGRGCGDCHNPHSDTDKKDVMKGCGHCHKNDDKEFNRFHGGLVLSVDKCFLCHMPHNAYNERLLRSKVHFPLAQSGNCIVCHKMESGKERKLGFIMNKTEICFKCHGDKKPLIGYDKDVHPPVFYGDCIQCHSPHLKLRESQLLLPKEELCYKCHENFAQEAKNNKDGSIHPPVEENDCLACHDAHKSENAALLKKSLNGLCFECHDDKKSIVEGKTMSYYHEPPSFDLCTNCHSPHVSKKKNLLKEKD